MRVSISLTAAAALVVLLFEGCAFNHRSVAISQAPLKIREHPTTGAAFAGFRTAEWNSERPQPPSLPAAVRTSSLYDGGDWSPAADATGLWDSFYGIPVESIDPADDVFLKYSHFVVSYDPDGFYPVWTAHVLTKASVEVGDNHHFPRPSTWSPEKRLSPFMTHVPVDDDFADLGGITDSNDPLFYERGHMSAKEEIEGFGEPAMLETFRLANQAPEIGTLNGGTWGKLERHCRYLALAQGNVWVFTGPVFKDPLHPKTLTGKTNVAVARPDAFWKIVLFSMPDRTLHVAAFIMPHQKCDSDHMYQKYQKTVAEVEAATGLTFFSLYNGLPPDFKTSRDPTMERLVKIGSKIKPTPFLLVDN